jgi:hypothetical protein
VEFSECELHDDSIPQSRYRYTGKIRGKYTGNSYSREPAPMIHILIDALLTAHLRAR